MIIFASGEASQHLAEASPSAGEKSGSTIPYSTVWGCTAQELPQVQPAKSLQVLPKKKVRSFPVFDVASKAEGECS